jgi:hypothetical protein
MPRPSQLDPCVRLSPHTAPDILSFRFCSCGCNGGRIHVLLQGFPASNFDDFCLRGVDGFFHPLGILIRRIDMNGFAVLEL